MITYCSGDRGVLNGNVALGAFKAHTADPFDARPRGAPPAASDAHRGIMAARVSEARWSPERLALLALGWLLLLRLVLLPWAVLIPEEAYYWMYARHPSLGYLDHPPMVAWIIAAGRAVFGDTEFGVRIVGALLAVASTGLCYRLTADWAGRRAGIAGALLFTITPLFCGTGFVTTPDAPLLFFWLLALVAITRAYRTEAQGWWLVAGLAVGLGFLSKYPAVLLLPGAFLFLLSDRRGRRMLARPGPWLALVVAAACTLPVVWWNAQHDWASFRFQFARRMATHEAFVPGRSLEWLGAQFGLLSPLIFVLFTVAWIAALRRFRRDRFGRWRFAACFAIPWLAICTWHGLFTWVNINWPLPAYLSLIPVSIILLRGAGPFWRRRFSLRQRRRLVHAYAATLVAVVSAVLIFVSLRSSYVPRWDVFAPWDQLGAATETIESAFATETGSEPFIVTEGQYKLASELAFYMREDRKARDWSDLVPARAVFGGGLNYVHWQSIEKLLGRNAIYVGEDVTPRELAGLKACFREVGTPEEFFSRRHGFGAQQTYSFVRCREFLGVPADLARD